MRRSKTRKWKIWKETNSPVDFRNYKKALNKCTSGIREAKRNFEKKLARNIKNYPKAYYRHVRSSFKTKDKVGSIADDMGNIVPSDKEAARLLNEYFATVFTTEDCPHLPSAQVKFRGLEENMLRRISFSEADVQKKLTSLKIGKSPGNDQVYARVLKELAIPLSGPLAKIFNESLNTGIVPEDWKEANVTPLFKKGNRQKPENYRPVSLTSQVMESLL